MAVYRRLTSADLEQVRVFQSKILPGPVMQQWTRDGLTRTTPHFLAVGEFVKTELTGLVSACSLGYWLQAKELMPMWCGIRLDRLSRTRPSFTQFLENTSSLIADHFEAQGYFQHVIVRRIPKNFKSNLQLSQITQLGWAQGPYQCTVDRLVYSEDDWAKLPILYKTMIGKYVRPVAVCVMNMPNELRETRSGEVRSIIVTGD